MAEAYGALFGWGLFLVVMTVLVARGVHQWGNMFRRDLIAPVKSALQYRGVLAAKRYDQMSELDKAQWDKRMGQYGKGVSLFVGIGGGLILSSLFPPLWFLAVPVTARAGYRYWKASNELIEDADERRIKALSA